MRLTVQKVRAKTASYELSPRDWKSSSIPEGGREKKSEKHGARPGEEIVDLLQDLLGLALDVGGGIAGDLARQVDGVAMHDGGAQALARLDALDAHGVLLLWIGQGVTFITAWRSCSG